MKKLSLIFILFFIYVNSYSNDLLKVKNKILVLNPEKNILMEENIIIPAFIVKENKDFYVVNFFDKTFDIKEEHLINKKDVEIVNVDLSFYKNGMEDYNKMMVFLKNKNDMEKDFYKYLYFSINLNKNLDKINNLFEKELTNYFLDEKNSKNYKSLILGNDVIYKKFIEDRLFLLKFTLDKFYDKENFYFLISKRQHLNFPITYEFKTEGEFDLFIESIKNIFTYLPKSKAYSDILYLLQILNEDTYKKLIYKIKKDKIKELYDLDSYLTCLKENDTNKILKFINDKNKEKELKSFLVYSLLELNYDEKTRIKSFNLRDKLRKKLKNNKNINSSLFEILPVNEFLLNFTNLLEEAKKMENLGKKRADFYNEFREKYKNNMQLDFIEEKNPIISYIADYQLILNSVYYAEVNFPLNETGELLVFTSIYNLIKKVNSEKKNFEEMIKDTNGLILSEAYAFALSTEILLSFDNIFNSRIIDNQNFLRILPELIKKYEDLLPYSSILSTDIYYKDYLSKKMTALIIEDKNIDENFIKINNLILNYPDIKDDFRKYLDVLKQVYKYNKIKQDKIKEIEKYMR